jgi:hypothetical protein
VGQFFVLPVIRPEDYNAFRRDIGHHIANSYEEWAKLVAGEVAQARQDGKTVVERVVVYSDFTRYCVAMGRKPDAEILLQFAAHTPLGEA